MDDRRWTMARRETMNKRHRVARRSSFISQRKSAARHRPSSIVHRLFFIALLMFGQTGCRQIGEKLSVRPRALRDVPAARLAFRLEPDVNESILPASLTNEAPEEPLAPV